MLKRWANYLSSPEFVIAFVGTIFIMGMIYDSLKGVGQANAAVLAKHEERIVALENERQRLSRIEQKLDDLHEYFFRAAR